MKLKSILKNTIAIGAIVSIAVNCKPDKIEENALLGILVSRTISNLASGNCAISINNTALYTGAAVSVAVGGSLDGAGANDFRTHYNAVTGKSITNLATEPYNAKYDAFFTDLGTWNDAKRASYTNTIVVFAEGGCGGACTATAPRTTLLGLKGIRGTGSLACARIPRAQCSLAGTTTANRATDITNAANVYNAYANNPDCRKTNLIANTMLNNLFKGDTTGTAIAISGGTFTNPTSNTDTNQLNTNQAILGEKMYPKFGSLVSLGFGTLMPVKVGTEAHSVTSSSLVLGANIAYTQVDSCEAIGLPSTGFTASQTNPLTSTKEIAYALSTNGLAASAFNTAVGNTSSGYVATQAGEDAKICNNSFRANSPPSLSLGGGKLPDVNGGAGDGGQTGLLTVCTYGSTSATRNTATTGANAVLGTGALTGLAECPAAASAGAAKFGDTGLTNLSNFPND
jgi:hypothetical protein